MNLFYYNCSANESSPDQFSFFGRLGRKLKLANWEQPGDMKQTYNTADLLGKSSSRVVFDIGGNNHRMICKYLFGAKQVHLFVCWIGTHKGYDKICKRGEQFTINDY